MAIQRGPALTALSMARRTLVDIRHFGAKQGTDCTAVFASAFAQPGAVYVPAGTWYADTIVMGIAGQQLVTDGFATKLRQNASVANGIRLLNVTASDCVVGTFTGHGNIATQGDEQSHVCFVRGAGSISNITIGDIVGMDVRGDVLYLGPGVSGVRFGRIIGRNILRNVVSITGACYVRGDAAIVDGGCGLLAFDIEPDATASTDIYVGLVKGGALQCGPALAANTARRIHIGHADLDPAMQPNSTPPYASYATAIPHAVTLRNTVDIRIDHLKMRNHTGLGMRYISNVGETLGRSVHIGYLDVANVGSGESTYNAVLLCTSVESIRIDDGDVALYSASKYLILGNSAGGATKTRISIGGLRIDGCVARYCKSSVFEGIEINTAAATTAFRDIEDSVVSNSDITIPTLASYAVGCTFQSVNATCSTAYIGSASSNIRSPGSKFGGVLPSGTFTFPAANAAVVNNPHVRSDSTILIIPQGGSAAALVGGVKSPYIAAKTANVSFQVSTANGAAAVGTELFGYVIL